MYVQKMPKLAFQDFVQANFEKHFALEKEHLLQQKIIHYFYNQKANQKHQNLRKD